MIRSADPMAVVGAHTDATTTAWSLGSNWVGGVAPQAGDDVVVYGGTTVGKVYGSNNSGFGTITLNSLTLAATEGNQSLTLSSQVNIGAGGIDVQPTASARFFFGGPIVLAADQTWKGSRPVNPETTAPISGPYKVTYDGTGAGAYIFVTTNSPSWSGGLDLRGNVSQLNGAAFTVGTTITPFGTGTITMINRKMDGTTAVSPEFRVNAPPANTSVATAYTYANDIVLSDPLATGNFSIIQDQNSGAPSSGNYHYYIFSGNISGNVNAARQLRFTTVNSPITGSGAFILTGNNTYTAETVTDASTLLQIGNGGTAGTLGTGTVSNAGILRFNRSDALTVGNVLTGAGEFQQAGEGTTTLTGTNTHSGLTTISSGSLQIGAGGTAGTLGTGGVANAATLLFNRSDALTVANVISGAGVVRQVGGGTTSLTGANDYTGPTEVAAGTLRIGAAGTTGSIGSTSGISVAEGATLAFNRTDAYGGGFDRAISGAGGVVISSGTLTLSGSNDFSGGTTFSGSTLVVGGTAALGTGLVTGTSSAVLSFNLPSSGTVANDFLLSPPDAGSSIVNQSATSTVTLSGEITATNGFFTFAGQGVNQAGFALSGSTVFPNTRLIVKDTNLTIESSTAVPVTTFGNRISLGDSGGSAAAVYLADGVSLGVKVVDAHNNDIIAPLAMTVGMNTTGSSTFAGVFGNEALDLHVRNTGGTGNTWNVTAPAGATVNFTGRIVNTGTNFQAPLTKTGLGTAIFSATNTYGGATTVSAGTLLVNGQLTASAVTVANGGTLGGTGTITSSVSVNSGGVLAPGASPGLLSVGSLSLDAGSTTILEIDGLTRGSLYDAIDVASGLSYGGGLELDFGSTFDDNSAFALFALASGSRTGGFSSITATGSYGSLTFTNDAGVWSSGPTSVAGQAMTFTESTGALVIVPEPHLVALGGLGAALAARSLLRRKR